jgi:Fur family transcriptional regulator, peroxide stress response regulator
LTIELWFCILITIPIIIIDDEMKTYKRSRQRDKILQLLKNTTTHPTADWVYDQLKMDFPDISMGTVYRNLNILIDQGAIGKIDFGSTFDRFDGNNTHHYHFICEKCNAIFDLEIPVDSKLNEKAAKGTSFKVNRHRIEFYGNCKQCNG